MDEITKGWLEKLSELYPNCHVVVTHQFLSGTNHNPAGLVPNDWNGKRVVINSQPKEAI